MLEKEQLLKKLNNNKPILNDEMIEYMYRLLELELSVLDKNNIDNPLNNYLSKLAIFNQIVVYNIYNKSFDLLDDDYTLKDNNNVARILNNKEKVLYKFSYDKILPSIELYQTKQLKPLGQRRKEIKIQISALEKELDSKIKEEYPCKRLDGFIEEPIVNTNWYINKYRSIDDLKREIKYLKCMLKEDVEFKFLEDAETISNRNKILNNFLDMNNLDINDDFETQIVTNKQKQAKVKIKTYNFANIIIK